MAKRINFSLIKSKYDKIGKSNVRLTQSSLFITKDIDPTKSNYDFDVLENQTQTLQPDEIRLNINDEFIVTHLGVYLYGTWTIGETRLPFTTGNQLLTYAPLELDSTSISVKNLYSGQLKIAVNNIVYLEKWDTRKHEKVTRTQFVSEVDSVNGVASATMPSNCFEDDAMIAFEPMLTLSGAKKNDISIRLPQSISPASVTFKDQQGNNVVCNITKIALRMYGLNAQNGAKFQN